MVLIKALLTGLLGVSLCIMKKNVWYRGVILVGLLAIMQTASADWQHSSAGTRRYLQFSGKRDEYFCGRPWYPLLLRYRDKLDLGRFWITNTNKCVYLSFPSLQAERISLPVLTVTASFFPLTMGRPGPRSIPDC